MVDKCSYCEREYGTKGLRKQLILKTFDHLTPLSHIIPRDKLPNMRKLWKPWLTYKNPEINNVISCCNECNSSKGDLTLKEWRGELFYRYINSSFSNFYLRKSRVYILIENLDMLIKDNNYLKPGEYYEKLGRTLLHK